LGAGAFGSVCLAVKEEDITKNKNFDDAKKYALKKFDNSLVDSLIFAGYEAEWRKLDQVKGHPSILDFIDHFEDSGMHFIVTEFCEVSWLFKKKTLLFHSLFSQNYFLIETGW
jgi:serine/threonine protein kinase